MMVSSAKLIITIARFYWYSGNNALAREWLDCGDAVTDPLLKGSYETLRNATGMDETCEEC